MEMRKLAFLALFTIISLAAYQLKFSTILGVPSQNFNFFQFIGPIGAGRSAQLWELFQFCS